MQRPANGSAQFGNRTHICELHPQHTVLEVLAFVDVKRRRTRQRAFADSIATANGAHSKPKNVCDYGQSVLCTAVKLHGTAQQIRAGQGRAGQAQGRAGAGQGSAPLRAETECCGVCRAATHQSMRRV
jgi:hypothetical protein